MRQSVDNAATILAKVQVLMHCLLVAESMWVLACLWNI